MLRVEPDQGEQMEIDLELIACTFVPIIGDQLVLDCNVQLDESFVDMKGMVVDVDAITPSRSKQLEGRVTRIDMAKQFGEVDRTYCFFFDALDTDYSQPQVGDRVSVDAIESKQLFRYSWRCLKVVLMEAVEPKQQIEEPVRANEISGMVISGNLHVILNLQKN